MTQEQVSAVIRQSRHTILVVQIVEGALLGVAAIVITVLALLLFDARHHIDIQQGIILAQQQKIQAEQQKIEAIANANTAEGRRVRAALCDSQYTIATITIPPVTTKVLVQFVESARKAFVVLQCPGRLGLPPKALIQAGIKFEVPIRY